MTLRQIYNYVPGKYCECCAACEYECGCDADWTPQIVMFLEWKLAKYTSLMWERFQEERYNSVTKETTTELRDFANVINEDISVDGKLNPALERWADEEIDGGPSV